MNIANDNANNANDIDTSNNTNNIANNANDIDIATNTNDIANNAPTYFMSSPEPQVFPSRELLKDYLFNSARAKGYIMTTSRSSADDYFILSCDRGGQHRSFKKHL